MWNLIMIDLLQLRIMQRRFFYDDDDYDMMKMKLRQIMLDFLLSLCVRQQLDATPNFTTLDDYRKSVFFCFLHKLEMMSSQALHGLHTIDLMAIHLITTKWPPSLLKESPLLNIDVPTQIVPYPTNTLNDSIDTAATLTNIC